jgi:hypothetical protein
VNLPVYIVAGNQARYMSFGGCDVVCAAHGSSFLLYEW